MAIAMYLRLSLEDEKKEESNSITNQRMQILDYIHHSQEFAEAEVMEFSDDGCSGTSMNRPGLQKMLEEVKANKIRGILVKDMSRFSRDYIDLGKYLNQIFPFMGVRFIAINDHYDSREHEGSTIEIDTAFKTLLYDLYSKDISVKVKSSFQNKCENGEYIFGQAPFGYEKSKEVKNTVVINKTEAEIVRRVFSLADQGKSSTQIAKILHEEGVPTKMQLRYPKKYKEKEGDKGDRIETWSHLSVRDILNNRFYLGEMIYGKSKRKHVGSHGGISLPKEEWKTIPNHHEALVTPEVFERVQRHRPCGSTKRKREKHPLVGKLFCGGCGYSMSYKPIRESNRYRRFECRKHSLLQIPDCCTCFSADLLEELVLTMINKELMLRGNAVKQNKKLVSFQQSCISRLNEKLSELRRDQKQNRVRKDQLYEKYALGGMPAKEYAERAAGLEEEFSSLTVMEHKRTSELAAVSEAYSRASEDMKQVIRFAHLEELTQEVVDTFIIKILVYRDKRVKIEWSFQSGRGISSGRSSAQST